MGNRKKSKPKNARSEVTKEGSSSKEPENSFPFNVESSKVLGRYLVANRDLKAGEVVLTDERIVIGPCQESKPMCIGCFVDIDLDDEESYKRCSKCSWPLCSKQCPGSHWISESKNNPYICHSLEECYFLSKTSIKKLDAASLKTCFYAITPLRLLLIRLLKPETWKIIEGLESHTEIRRKNVALWKMNEEMAVQKIVKTFGVSQFSPEEIHFVCGVLEVNAFEVTISGNTQPLRAIYPNASLFSHDCVPNTSHSNGEGFSLIVRTTKCVAKKSPLTVSYTYTLQSTLNRRKHLLDTKFFLCSCKRCSDITEYGVYCSAFKCPTCKVGLVLPQNPLDSTSDWVCRSHKCSYKVSVSVIHLIFEKISNELDSIDGNDIEGYENFLKKYCNILYENHCLCLSALHSLSQLYGKTSCYMIDKLTEEQLHRKIEICRKLIKVFEKLEPGLSKQRGILLYELQAPLMVILKKRFEKKNITKKEFKQKFEEVNTCLEETCKIFASEWGGTTEGIIALAAKQALESMKDWKSITSLF